MIVQIIARTLRRRGQFQRSLASIPSMRRRLRTAESRVRVDIRLRLHNAILRVAFGPKWMEKAHMPGFRGDPNGELPDPRRFQIPEIDATTAAAKGIIVVGRLSPVVPRVPPSVEILRCEPQWMSSTNRT
jgi:hypothetical protein